MDCCSSDDPASEAPLACSLGGRDLAARQRWLSNVTRRALSVEQSANGITLKFSHDVGLEAELRALAEAEAECCGFLRFGVRRVGDSVEITVAGPPAAQPIIEEIFGSVTTKTIRIFVTLLLVASAALFAIGVAIERGSKHSATHAARGVDFVLAADQHVGESAAHRAAETPHPAETPAHRAAEQKRPKSAAPANSSSGSAPAEGKPGHRETPTESGHSGESPAQLASEKHGERVFGIDIESPALVIAAVAVSLLLAAALWLTGSVLAPLALAGFALVAAIFDVREVFHQIDESRTNLTVIAAIVAALHLAVVAGALVLARRLGRGRPASVAP